MSREEKLIKLKEELLKRLENKQIYVINGKYVIQ